MAPKKQEKAPSGDLVAIYPVGGTAGGPLRLDPDDAAELVASGAYETDDPTLADRKTFASAKEAIADSKAQAVEDAK